MIVIAVTVHVTNALRHAQADQIIHQGAEEERDSDVSFNNASALEQTEEQGAALEDSNMEAPRQLQTIQEHADTLDSPGTPEEHRRPRDPYRLPFTPVRPPPHRMLPNAPIIGGYARDDTQVDRLVEA